MFTNRQRAEFFQRGFTRVTGALSGELVAGMVSRIWDVLESQQGMQADDPSTWVEGGVRGIGDLNKEQEFRPFEAIR